MTVIEGVAVDVTALFRSTVSNVKTREKEFGEQHAKSRIFPPQKGSFFINAKDISINISSHHKLLLEHKRNYLKDEDASFSEMDKIYLEKVIVKNLKTIDTNIKSLETEMKGITNDLMTSQALECKQNALNIIKKNYLVISTLFKNMKDSRLRKQKEKDMLLSLHRPSSHKSNNKIVIPVITPKSDDYQTNGTTREDVIEKEKPISFMDREGDNILSQLSSEESQLLQEENDHLHKELLSNRDEIKQITSQVVELSKMQDMLTENVDIQGQQIDDIHETVIASTDNVQRGNEEIREAMRKDAAFRVWIMFILIVMSLSILFLDWYNP